jgi:hypothetical protein
MPPLGSGAAEPTRQAQDFPITKPGEGAIMPQDHVEISAGDCENLPGPRKAEEPANKTDCPLWASFAAAREAGIETTEAFLEAMRTQTLRSLSLFK